MSNNCQQCEKWKLKQQEILHDSESIFDAYSDITAFEKDCIKTCPYLKEIVDTSTN